MPTALQEPLLPEMGISADACSQSSVHADVAGVSPAARPVVMTASPFETGGDRRIPGRVQSLVDMRRKAMWMLRIPFRIVLVAAVTSVFLVAGTVSADGGETLVVEHDGVITGLAEDLSWATIEGGLVNDGRMNYDYDIRLDLVEVVGTTFVYNLSGEYTPGNPNASGSVDINGVLELDVTTFAFVQPEGATSFGVGTGRTSPLTGATLDGFGQLIPTEEGILVEGTKFFTFPDDDAQ